MKFLMLILAAFSVSRMANAADITGAWKIHGSVFFNSVDTTCHFKKDGNAVLGTCENDSGPGEYTPVTISGANVDWSWNPGEALLTFQAALTSDTTMKGKILVRGFTGGFTATKQ